jgi:hypothetical protein
MEVAMADFKVNPQPWMRDAVKIADNALVKSIVEDFRHGIPSSGGSVIPGQRPASTVSVVGSGKVQDAGLGPKYRQYQAPPEDTADRSGWRDAQALKPPEGVALVDELVFQQDVADLAAKGREQAAAMGISLADWVKLQLRERQEKKLRDKGPQK